MYFNEKIETMNRGELDVLIEERIRYTVNYANEHSPFYRKWFREHGINPSEIRTHEDLRDLPIISGRTIRKNQPPESPDFPGREMHFSFTCHQELHAYGDRRKRFQTDRTCQADEK